jgi:hypothetical protein
LLILVILHYLFPFVASIHCLSEPFSYKKAIIDPLWQQAMEEKLSVLHKINT